MDDRLRKLERRAASEPEALVELNLLRCRLQGCLVYKIQLVYTGYDANKMVQLITIVLEDGDPIIVELTDRNLLNHINIMRQIHGKLLTIAKCPRCFKKNDKDADYLYEVADKLGM